jgi:hypothetical protein
MAKENNMKAKLATAIMTLCMTTPALASDWGRVIGAVVIGAAVATSVKGTAQHQETQTTNHNVWGTERHPNQRPIFDQYGRVVGHTWANQGGHTVIHPAVIYNTLERARMFADPDRAGHYVREQLEQGRLPRW